MSSRESFSDTPKERPTSTPRKQLLRQEAVPGSILKTIFSPNRWFGRGSSAVKAKQAPGDESDSSRSASSDENDESDHDHDESHNSTDIHASLRSEPQTPGQLASQSDSNASSPNAVLASFFSNKGDAPLTVVELEGVKSLLAKQTDTIALQQTKTWTPPSYATPARRAYQPIFTPAKILPSTRAATEVRKVRRGYTPSTTVASPFRQRNPVRTGFSQARIASPGQYSTPTKYDLQTILPANDRVQANGKRDLDEVLAPAAKRPRQNETSSGEDQKPAVTSTGSKTAASMLEILESDITSSSTPVSRSPEQLKAMLNPYASPASAKRPARSPRKTPAKPEQSVVKEQLARNGALERKTPYQPKKSSGLSNSFSAADATEGDTSLFSPRRRTASPAVKRNVGTGLSSVATQASSENHPVSSAANTPTKSLTSAFGDASQSSSLFGTKTSIATYSTTPKFSFAASQSTAKAASGGPLEEDTEMHNSYNQIAEADTQMTSSVEEDSSFQGRSDSKGSTMAHPSDDALNSSVSRGFMAADPSEVSNAPGFGLGNVSNTSDKHKSTGSFVFGSQPELPQASELTEGVDDTRNSDGSIVVHQLRDGTEYVSPSKAPSHAPAVSEAPTTQNSGFVFQPTHTKSASSFSFANYKASDASTTTSTGFVFDPTKSVAGSKAAEPVKAVQDTAQADSSQSEDDRSRALAVPEAQLHEHRFSLNKKCTPTELQVRVLSADVIHFQFSAPTNEVSLPRTVPEPGVTTSSGFNWAAAGMKKPEGGWSCDVCMVSNQESASQCISCESDRPVSAIGTSEQTGAATTKPTAGGGFDWAAAGIKAPSQTWSCSVCLIANPTTTTQCLACETER